MARRTRTTPRKKPRQERSTATVEVILDATARVLVSTGYDRASTNRIALAAGVSVGSLYQYFPSKEALVAALAGRHMGRMITLVRVKLVELATAPVPVGVRAMIEAMFAAHAVDPQLHKVLIEQVPRVGRLENLRGVEDEIETLVAAFMESRRSEFRRSDLATASFVLVHVVEAVSHAVVLHRNDPARTKVVADELTDLVLRYIQA